MVRLYQASAIFWLLINAAMAIEIDFSDPDSIKAGASTIAYGMMSYYKGNDSGGTPGLLPYPPWYWWESGAMFGAMIDYWHYTGDTTYNDVVSQALLFQVGPNDDYMPPNQTFDMGNDDQAFWAISALSAAEANFPNPPADQPQWLALAQAVFNEQVSRWDTQWCNGGIRWQVYPSSGYNEKNTISNGCLFQIAARLARYTGDDMYAQWAVKIWNWLYDVGLIDDDYNVYDNADADPLNCSQIDRNQWTYNAGTLIMGASTMYNYTNGSDIWYNRTQGLLTRTEQIFFPDGVMEELCERSNNCNIDQDSFKAYLARWMAAATQMAPFTFDQTISLLTSSAIAAAAQCDGSPGGNVCGLKWYLNSTWDGTSGVGQQMAALEVIQGTLIHQSTPALTNKTGGTSLGNPTAGVNTSSVPPQLIVAPATKGDKGSAWALTAFIVAFSLWGIWFMTSRAWEYRGTLGPTVAGKFSRANEKGKDIKRTNSVRAVAQIDEEANLERRDSVKRLQKRSSVVLPPSSRPQSGTLSRNSIQRSLSL